MASYITLENLQVYKLAKKLSCEAWEIYSLMDWRTKKIIGDQFVSSVDSSGANIAEGYGRYHYLDRVKFYYNARGFLLEATHWINLLIDRNLVSKEKSIIFIRIIKELELTLNGIIRATMKTKSDIITKRR